MSPEKNSGVSRLRVPILLPTGRDAPLVGRVLEKYRVDVATCATMDDLLDHIRNECGPFVIGAEVLSRNATYALITALENQSKWSDLPGVVLLEPRTKRRHLSKLSGLREISMIQRPLGMSVFVNLMLTAIEARKRQYQVCDLLYQMEQNNQKLQSRTEMLQKLSFELTRAEDRERKRIARVLHDDLQQMLAAAKLQAELHFEELHEDTLPRAQKIHAIISKAMKATRDLSHDLNPDSALGTRLPEAMQQLVARMTEDYGLKIDFAFNLANVQMSNEVRRFIFRSAREMLFNCAKHAEAKHVLFEINSRADTLDVVITDDGSGFNPDQLNIYGGPKGGFGLFSITEQAGVLGGSFTINSSPGKGCRMILSLPIGPNDVDADEPPPANQTLRRRATDKRTESGKQPGDTPVSI